MADMKADSKGGSKTIKTGPIRVMGANASTYKSGKGKKAPKMKSEQKKGWK